MHIPLYIFDMDETLVDGDTSSLWIEYLISKGLCGQEVKTQEQALMVDYALGDLDLQAYMDLVVSPISHIPSSQVDSLVDDFVSQCVMPKVFPQAKDLIDALLAAGVEIIVISASATFIVQSVVKRLGITHAIGVNTLVKDGFYTSKIVGVPSYREGKIACLKHWIQSHHADFDETHFYTDSINDLPLCEFADFAYLINPRGQLAAVAATHPEWTTFNWQWQ